MDRYEEAYSAYEEAFRLFPSATNWSLKGITLNRLKKHEEALTAYDEALLLDPDDASFWHKRGHILKLLGRPEEAKQCYEKARKLGYKQNNAPINFLIRGTATSARPPQPHPRNPIVATGKWNIRGQQHMNHT